MKHIKSAAVIGAGVMGASIAALLASTGIKTLLLDIVPDEAKDSEDKSKRNALADKGLKQATKASPAAFYSKNDAALVETGNLEDDLDKLQGVDWVVEVVVEKMDIKKKLFKQVEENWNKGTIVSSNTSGLSINEMVSECSEEFQKHFMGTHFFNPPRYMKLFEVIPTPKTDPKLVEFMKDFATERLGKGVVLAKDTPNFIGNRIGVFSMLSTTKRMDEHGLTIEEVDTLTGRPLGRPKSATFRTLDLVGIDVFYHVAKNVVDRVSDEKEKEAFRAPDYIEKLVEKGRLGSKSGEGAYKKTKKDGKKEILTLDLETLEYREQKKAKFSSLAQLEMLPSRKKKIKGLVYSEDKAGKFAWDITKDLLLYSANKIPEISDDIVSIDRAMRWGFNWDYGPFELWDIIGVEDSVKKMEAEGEEVPQIVKDVLATEKKSFYFEEDNQTYYFDVDTKKHKTVEIDRKIINIANIKKDEQKIYKKSAGATILDMGDGIACFEMHSPQNAIGVDIINVILENMEDIEKDFRGMVLGSRGSNFCVGANLMMVLLEAQNKEWDLLDRMIDRFQKAMMTLKYSQIPVVAAPYSVTVGGGYEITAHCDYIQAAAETYTGLVEVGVGVIPAAGGCKEQLIRRAENMPKDADLTKGVNKAFETIAMATVATSAEEAKDHGYHRLSDGISINGDHQLYHAKQAAISMAERGYRPPKPARIKAVGDGGFAAMKQGIYILHKGGYISDYDKHIAEKLAYVLSGGRVQDGTEVSEQFILDLEREAFLSLLGEPKTQERMISMINTGKPKRN
ncbi:3-hydroxyacyl-CoA dehydrogenase/enoyl-CoA hydratase family protein [Natranaerofaba carboxydovora]|uniref:3-hydroxyacyl-CoA dehydrogenase/enoyl-CoA hydratase family protein n=1 Tax=Natranaerofaba carboxydovora TaxID=2742683 RepID=UPI001F13BAF6|nr:3-hydroxyacyl-CoA dehydrogenase/enoyl-CoA hydratase family protein [Natranaerofaba carboxydovora]UMZ73276.1 putative 3-hydroxyacyl-CoA dehydrogenase [Natranaerofaba carboxydovora]